jgi:hypothetical protein
VVDVDAPMRSDAAREAVGAFRDALASTILDDTMLPRPESACFVIADISGYTGFLAGVELDHAQDIIADVLDTILEGQEGPAAAVGEPALPVSARRYMTPPACA